MLLHEMINLDVDYCRQVNLDLAKFSDEKLKSHYLKHGYNEGRLVSQFAVREEFVSLMDQKSTLEIGPFFSPLLRGNTVKYADILSTDELKSRIAAGHGTSEDSKTVPNIDFVLRDGSLENIKEKFEAVVSCHNIEHQPDFIRHLVEVAGVLQDDGAFYLIIPNCNYCFDAILPETNISEILQAHHEKRTRHSLKSVVDHIALTVHNEPHRHWTEEKQSIFTPFNSALVATALKTYEEAQGEYIDVHAWQFSPYSFANVVRCLIELDLIPFRNFEVNGPVFGRNEFTAILKM